MLPLAFTNAGDYVEVVRVGGNDEAKQHLSDLGFVPGAYVTVISSHGGDIIVNVKESRLAITREMAQKIQVQPAKRIERGGRDEDTERHPGRF